MRVLLLLPVCHPAGQLKELTQLDPNDFRLKAAPQFEADNLKQV